MVNELRKMIEKRLFFVLVTLVSSNGYFVQRVITSVDNTTAEISSLKEHVARIEAKLEDLKEVQPTKWKKL